MEPFTEFGVRKEQLATLKKIGYELERGFEDLIGILRDIRQELSFINTHEIAEAIAPAAGRIPGASGASGAGEGRKYPPPTDIKAV